MHTKYKYPKRFLFVTSLILLSAILVWSCNAKTGTQPVAEIQPPAATLTESSPQAADIAVNISNTAPWYSDLIKAQGFTPIDPPRELPAFTVGTMNDGNSSLKDVAGKVVLLNFWATWCPPCRVEMPSMQTLYDQLKNLPFTIYAISVGESKNTVSKFIAETKYTFPVYLDPSNRLAGQFASRGIPTSYLLDKQGRAIGGVIGAKMYDSPEMIALMRSLAERLP